VPPPPAEDKIIGQGFFTGCFDFALSDKWKLFINPMLQHRENTPNISQFSIINLRTPAEDKKKPSAVTSTAEGFVY